MPNMGYLDPSSFQQYQHHQEPMSSHQMSYEQQMQHYAMAHQQNSMMSMPPTRTNETKPRLGKDEVDILEREFQKNPKPTTQVKRGFAEDMNVDLARINNWFQNRRAKRKQEKKQEAYEAGQAQEAMGFSDTASSPDFFHGNTFFNDMSPSASFPVMAGPPPPAVPSYNPQYQDPSGASLESLQRTMAQAASHQEYHGNTFIEQHDSLAGFGDSLLHDPATDDRAQFPAPESSHAQYDNRTYAFPSTFSHHMYNSRQSTEETQESPIDTTNQTPTPYGCYPPSSSANANSRTITTFPSQLHIPHGHDGLPSLTNDSSDSQSPDEDSSESHSSLDFKYDVTDSIESKVAPPAPSVPFKASAPMDIASRRKKVHVKPAALVAENLPHRPGMGPRTVSNADGFRRGVESPIGSPMRRIASAGGNRSNVLSGRVCKSGVESAQRSPINLGNFSDAGSFMEHNFHSMRNAPSLSALSSLNSSLAPPTPMSPRGGEMTLVKREGSRSTASPHEGSMNFVFNAGVPACFTTLEGDQSLASPPETPHAQMVLQNNGWSGSMDLQDKQWGFEVPDEPLYTPAGEHFPPSLELQMPQPSYLSNMSQPVTPAFGQFNPALIFGHDSPQFKNESPQYTLASSHAEYTFPDAVSHQYTMFASPMAKQKTFQFSNTTAADFSEK